MTNHASGSERSGPHRDQQGPVGQGHHGDTAQDWDERYGADEQMWSGAPNGSLVAEVEGLAPGTALDVGCGEGADAIWLARQGWAVTGLDISSTAIERARAAAEAARVDVTWTTTALVAGDTAVGTFDLVSVHYPALRRTPDAAAARAILGAVAPGGTLLVVGHDLSGREHALAHGFDPDDYLQPRDVLAHLDEGWQVERDEVRPRVTPPGYDGPDVPDVVVRARRRT